MLSASGLAMHSVIVLYFMAHSYLQMVNLAMLWPLCLLQDLYCALPVPDSLKDGEGNSSFGFLEKELRFSQM